MMPDSLAKTFADRLQIERHHQERMNVVWNQFKDAWVTIQALELGLLGFALAFPSLTLGARELLAAIIVLVPLAITMPMRSEAERRAAEIVSDFEADFIAVAGVAPPRPLVGRAMKRVTAASQSRPGRALMARTEE